VHKNADHRVDQPDQWREGDDSGIIWCSIQFETTLRCSGRRVACELTRTRLSRPRVTRSPEKINIERLVGTA
jgi:hypothetical protein